MTSSIQSFSFWLNEQKISFCDWYESVAGHVFPVCGGSGGAATKTTSNFCIVTLGGYLPTALSGFNPTSPVYCQITGSEGNLVHLVAAAGLKNRREKMERSCQMSSLSPPQLPSRLPLFFFIFAAKRQREIKGGWHERQRLCFSMPCLAALSPLQIWKCWIPNPACTYDAYSLPQPHLSYFLDSLPSLLPPCLNPSSSSSIPSSSAALGLLGAEALDWQLLWQSVERAESGWVSALLQGLKAAANVVASCRSERSPWNKTQSPLLFSLLLSTEAGRSQIAFSNRSRVYSGCGNWNISQTHILPGCFSLPLKKLKI